MNAKSVKIGEKYQWNGIDVYDKMVAEPCIATVYLKNDKNSSWYKIWKGISFDIDTDNNGKWSVFPRNLSPIQEEGDSQ